MITAKQVSDSFQLNLRVIKMQTEGLSHADSLIQTPYNINSLNWVLGHILESRDKVLELLGETPLLSPAERQRYQRDSEPITSNTGDLILLEREIELLEESQQRIQAGMERLTEEELQREITVGTRTQTVAQRLFFLYFHDTFHTGQTDLLRQVAGKADKII